MLDSVQFTYLLEGLLLSAENGISNEMANYLTMVFDPMAPSIRAAKTEKNSSYADRLANLSAELDRLLSSKNMTFLELMNAVAVRSEHSKISYRFDHSLILKILKSR